MNPTQVSMVDQGYEVNMFAEFELMERTFTSDRYIYENSNDKHFQKNDDKNRCTHIITYIDQSKQKTTFLVSHQIKTTNNS